MTQRNRKETQDPAVKARLEKFKEVQLTGTESLADLPRIRSQYNFPPPDTAADSPMSPMDVGMSPEYQDLSKPKLTIGDRAFDFVLPKLDMTHGEERDTGETVRLSDHLGKTPVALIFGSYT